MAPQIRTDGLVGRYCVLSHSWGRGSVKPTCVTSQNEHQYFRGIQISELSQTFQDAIHLTRNLQLRYIWIDSLCIVQNSTEHWRQESARMGAIYQGAYLRIAAAGANDSTEGLFGFHLCDQAIEDRPLEIRLPI